MNDGHRQTPALIVTLLALGWAVSSGVRSPDPAAAHVFGLSSVVVFACAAIVGRRRGRSIAVAAAAVCLALLARASLTNSLTVASYVQRGGRDAQAGLGGILDAFAAFALVGLLVFSLFVIWLVEVWSKSKEPPRQAPAAPRTSAERRRTRRFILIAVFAVLSVIAVGVARFDPTPWLTEERRWGLTAAEMEAAVQTWRTNGGAPLVDAAGRSFTKAPSWQTFRGLRATHSARSS